MNKFKMLDSRSSIWEIPCESLIEMPEFYKWLRSHPAKLFETLIMPANGIQDELSRLISMYTQNDE